MHQPYEQRLGHQADFRVKYRFYKPEEGGRSHLPYQGYRSDFWYEHPEIEANNIFMIWPEFENEKGEIILKNDELMPEVGTARMWIIVPERREFHRDNIKIGAKGYFKEGPKSVAECEIIEILGLPTNPTQKK
jgi:hypothetical protein